MLTFRWIQGPWHSQLADQNVFEDADKENQPKPYKKYEPEATVFDEIPDEYPFNELKGGHTWHQWKGESVMEALGEVRVSPPASHVLET